MASQMALGSLKWLYLKCKKCFKGFFNSFWHLWTCLRTYYNFIKIYLPERRNFQDGVQNGSRPSLKWLYRYISIEKKYTNDFSLDSGTSRHAYEHTRNLGKYTFRKGFIFKMASKMAAGSLEWLKWKQCYKGFFNWFWYPYAYLRTCQNLGKYTSWKGVIFKMAACSLHWLYLKIGYYST